MILHNIYVGNALKCIIMIIKIIKQMKCNHYDTIGTKKVKN